MLQQHLDFAGPPQKRAASVSANAIQRRFIVRISKAQFHVELEGARQIALPGNRTERIAVA